MTQRLRVGIIGELTVLTTIMEYARGLGVELAVMGGGELPAPVSSYDNIMEFGKHLDHVIVADHSVNTKALRNLARQGVKVFPSADVIDLTKDRYILKKFLETNDVPIAPFVPVLNHADLHLLVNKLPARLLKCRATEDGSDEMIINTRDDISNAYHEACILEEPVLTKDTVRVLVSRNESGDIECYSPVLMLLRDGRLITDFRLCPAEISQTTAIEICTLSVKIAEALDLDGMISIQMLITKNGSLLVDNITPGIAPPHDSEASLSQCEQHLRSILGISTLPHSPGNNKTHIRVLEPAAFRRRSAELAVKTLLNLHSNSNNRLPHALDEHTIETELSKAVLIKHMLAKSGKQDIPQYRYTA